MKILFPTTNHNISLPFGYDSSNDPELKDFYTLFDSKHPGVDFDLVENTTVYSSFAGVVIRSEFHKGMGNTIGIRNGNILALYAHLNEIKIILGEIVSEGQVIGLSGNTGEASTSPHLHFELRDLSKNILIDMVFKPEFDKTPNNFTETFIYKVKNENTPKTAELLSERYFGNKNYAEEILKINNLDLTTKDIIPNGIEIIIPNFRNQ